MTLQKGTKLLEERCRWARRYDDSVSGMGDLLRSYQYKDKCGQQWGYAWIFKAVAGGYMVLRYVHGGQTRMKTFKTAYRALKNALGKEDNWEYK